MVRVHAVIVAFGLLASGLFAVARAQDGNGVPTAHSCELTAAGMDAASFVKRSLGGDKGCVGSTDIGGCCDQLRGLYGASGEAAFCLCNEDFFGSLVGHLPGSVGVDADQYVDLIKACDLPVAGRLKCPGTTEEWEVVPKVQSQLLKKLLLAKVLGAGTQTAPEASEPSPPTPAVTPMPVRPAGKGVKVAAPVVTPVQVPTTTPATVVTGGKKAKPTAPAPAPTPPAPAPVPAPSAVPVPVPPKAPGAPKPVTLPPPKAPGAPRAAPVPPPKAPGAPRAAPLPPPKAPGAPRPTPPAPGKTAEVVTTPAAPVSPGKTAEVVTTPAEAPGKTPGAIEVTESTPAETPAEPTPAEPTPAEPTPAEPTPAEPTPAEPTPAEPTPTPTEPTPAEPTPAEPTPTEPTPVEMPEGTATTAVNATTTATGTSQAEAGGTANATETTAAAGAGVTVETTGGTATGAAEATAAAGAPADCQSVVQVAQATPDLSTLVSLVEAAGLADSLGPSFVGTVFAPTNAAFDALLAELGITAATLTDARNANLLGSLLKLHVVPGVAAMAADLTAGQTLNTLLGGTETLTIDLTDGVKIGSPGTEKLATVTMPDVQACGSVVHIIDSVLIPSPAVAALNKLGGGDAFFSG